MNRRDLKLQNEKKQQRRHPSNSMLISMLERNKLIKLQLAPNKRNLNNSKN